MKHDVVVPTMPANSYDLPDADYFFLKRCRWLITKHANKPLIAQGFRTMFFARKRLIS